MPLRMLVSLETICQGKAIWHLAADSTIPFLQERRVHPVSSGPGSRLLPRATGSALGSLSVKEGAASLRAIYKGL